MSLNSETRALALSRRPESPRPESRRDKGSGWRRYAPLLLASPSLVVLVFVFVTPVVLLVAVSFFPNDVLTGMRAGFDPGNYAKIWGAGYFYAAMGKTFGLAAIATVITAVISYPLALIINRRSRRLRVAVALIVVMPIFVSAVERSLGWISILGSGGLLERATRLIGFATPTLLYKPSGVALAFANTLLPFMFLSVYAAVRGIEPSVREAAASLGAGPLRVFFTVTLPLTYSGLASGATLVFSLAAGNVIVTMMIGGASITTLPTLLYQEATVVVNYPLSAVIGVSISLLILVIINLILAFAGRGSRGERVVIPA